MSHKPAATLSTLTSIVDEVVNAMDLRSAFNVTIPWAGMPEGDKDDNDDDNNDDDNDDDGGDEDDTDASGKGAEKPGDSIKDPEKKRLHDEAARYRNERNQLKKERDELAKFKRENEDKDKSELQKAQRDLQEVTNERDELVSELSSAKLDLAFFKSGVAGQFRDPADALKFLDLKDIKVDDDGNVPEKDIKVAAEALLKQKPYLSRTDDDDSGDDGDEGKPSGRPNNGRKRSKDEANREALEKKFPALQGRG